jgi:hypothetical protein
MFCLAAAVAAATLSTGAYRLVLAGASGSKLDAVFIAGYAIALTIPLLVIYVPLQLRLQHLARQFVESIYPLPDATAEWSEVLAARKLAEEYLAVDLRYRATSAVAVALVSPTLAAGAIALSSVALTG